MNLQVAQKDLQKRESELNNLSADLNARKGRTRKCAAGTEQRNTQLAELEKVLQEQESMLATLKKKVSDALLGFENRGTYRDTKERQGICFAR